MKLLTYLFLFVLISCSSNDNRLNNTSHDGSYLTQEERLKKAALERYRQMRLRDGAKTSKNYRYIKKNTSRPNKVVRKERPILTDPKELAIEIEQNMSFYCMQHRKSSKFKTQNCNDFIESVHTNCITKHDNEADKRRLFCVKKNLARGPR